MKTTYVKNAKKDKNDVLVHAGTSIYRNEFVFKFKQKGDAIEVKTNQREQKDIMTRLIKYVTRIGRYEVERRDLVNKIFELYEKDPDDYVVMRAFRAIS